MIFPGTGSDPRELLQFAGYHDDRDAFVTLLAQDTISAADAEEAYQSGQNLRDAGVRCACPACATCVPVTPTGGAA